MAKGQGFFSFSRTLADLGEKLLYRPQKNVASFREEEAAEPPRWQKRFPVKLYKIKIKNGLAKASEQSFFVGLFRKWIHSLLLTKIRSFGILFFVCGFVQVLSYFLGEWLPLFGGSEENLLFGVAQLFITILCVFSRWSVAEGFRRSLLFCSIVEPLLGIREWKIPRGAGKDHLGTMAFLGVVFGLLSVFLNPFTVLAALLWTVLLCVILCFPEAGTAFFSVGLFFASREALCLIALTTALALLLKSSVGKRSLVFSPMDPAVALVLLPLLFLGEDRQVLTVFSLFAVYFVQAGLIRTMDGAKRFLSVLCVAAFWFSAFLFLGEVLLRVKPRWFTDYPFFETVFFLKPTLSLGGLLALLCPTALSRMRFAKTGGQKLFSFLTVLLLLCGLYFTKSSALWISAALGMALYVFFSNRFALIWIAAGGMLCYIALQVLPVSVLERLLSALGFASEGAQAGSPRVVLQYVAGHGGIVWAVLCGILLVLYLYEVVCLPFASCRMETHSRVLGTVSTVAVFLCMILQGILPDYRHLALIFLLLSFPRIMSGISRREETCTLY